MDLPATHGRSQGRASAWRSWFILGVLVLIGHGLQAAPIPPPFHVLYDPHNVIVSARLLEVAADGRLVLERVEVLHGEAIPELIEIAAPEQVGATAQLGAVYLVAYTPFRRDATRARRMIVAPDGPRLLVTPGLEPAWFPDQPDYRRLIAYGEGGDIHERSDAVEVILAALADPQAPMQAFAAAQLALDPGLWPRLSASELDRVRETLADPDTSWLARAWLYDWAGREPDRFGQRWLRRLSVRVLAQAPLRQDQGLDQAGQLVNAIFVQADLRAWPVPERTLLRWLESDNTAFAEQALLHLRRQWPDREGGAVRDALARTALEPQMRDFLEAHQRRLQRRAPSSRNPGN